MQTYQMASPQVVLQLDNNIFADKGFEKRVEQLKERRYE